MKTWSELKNKLFDYGPNPETTQVEIKPKYDLFINGEFVPPIDQKYYEVINPATAQPLCQAAYAKKEDVDRAVEAARHALEQWKKVSGSEKARLIFTVARIIHERSRELAIIETLNNGKPIRETRDIDIPLAARHFFYHAGWADKLEELNRERLKPVGVVAAIIPWNFPLLMAAWKLAPALCCGNTVVLKPAETTPLTALHLAQIFKEAGFPPGVVNVITGFGDTGSWLAKHPQVDKIAFTGSTEVGKIIKKESAGSRKKISLELGGKSPTIVFDDAPMYEAVEGIMDSIFFNQGQVCCAGSRLLIQENAKESFIGLLKERMAKIRIGDPMDKNIDMGAIHSLDQLEKIRRYISIGKEEGAVMWQAPCQCPSQGFFFPPTLFTNVEPSHSIAQEEIFGPVLVVMTFRTPEEAVELANNTGYGLAASVWTKDVSKMVEVARALKAGTVWGNGTNKFDAAAEFGGYKESGFGREGGLQGLWEYLQIDASLYPDQSRESKNPPSQLPETAAGKSSLVWKSPKILIGGKQVRSESGRYMKIYDPTGKKLLANINQGSRKDIRDAVEASEKAWAIWSKTTPYNRGQILYRIAEMLSARAEEFANKLSLQTGLPLPLSKNEVQVSLERLLYYAGWADKYAGTVNPITQTDFNITLPEAVGVAALITPKDYPLLAMISKLAPAFASGNSMVIIPSQEFPLSATDFIEVIDASDVPPGVVNIITGIHEELVPILAEHRAVGIIDFSGSASMAKKVEELSVSNLKRTHIDDGKTIPWLQAQGKSWIRRYLEFKTVWITSGF